MRRSGQDGFSLLEVLIAAFVLGVAVVGMTLLMSRGQNAVVSQGDTRIALYLAQQKIERLRGLGYSAADVGNQVNTGCTNPATSNEPCYNETNVTAGTGQQTPTTTQVDTQTFTRLTCVRWVRDDNPELPADPVEPPSSWTCPSCTSGDPATDPMTCGSTGTGTCCTGNTRRIKVAVIPNVLGGVDTTMTVDPDRVTLEFVMTPTAKP